MQEVLQSYEINERYLQFSVFEIQRWNIIGIFVELYIIDWFQLSVLQRYVNICNSLCAIIIDFHYNSNFEAIIVQLNMFVETQSNNNVIESYLKRSLLYHLF